MVSWLKCEYMQSKLGEEFEGVISAVTSFGFFVELTDIFVEGLVHISNLDKDYFHYDPIGHRLAGERSGITYRLGDKVRVLVARVDLDERKIDFVLIARTATAKRATKGSGAKPAAQQGELSLRARCRPTPAPSPGLRPSPSRFRLPPRKPSRTRSADWSRSPKRAPVGAASAE